MKNLILLKISNTSYSKSMERFQNRHSYTLNEERPSDLNLNALQCMVPGIFSDGLTGRKVIADVP